MFVRELWRYPVKSMGGEVLSEARVGSLGFVGDRQRAVVDPDSGVSLSAKRHGDLLLCRARTADGGVTIGLPDGSEFDADSAEATESLSDFLGRKVEVRKADAGEPVHHEYTTDTTTGEGDPMVVEAPGTDAFFDGLPVHLLTDATLREFTRLQPGSVFDRMRFRPNLLVHADEDGFVEDAWVGGQIIIGEVVFAAAAHKTRCVMTTRPQEHLEHDREVFKTVVASNERRAGIELEPISLGTIRAGDPVVVTHP